MLNEREGRRLVREAVREGDVKKLKSLQSQVQLQDIIDLDELLTSIVKDGNVDLLKEFRKWGAKAADVQIAFPIAVQQGQLAIVKELKHWDVDPFTLNWGFKIAAENGKLDFVKEFKNWNLSTSGIEKGLRAAAAEAHVNILQEIYKWGLAPATQASLVHSASRNGQVKVLQELQKWDIPLSAIQAENNLALNLAVKHGDVSTIKELRHWGLTSQDARMVLNQLRHEYTATSPNIRALEYWIEEERLLRILKSALRLQEQSQNIKQPPLVCDDILMLENDVKIKDYLDEKDNIVLIAMIPQTPAVCLSKKSFEILSNQSTNIFYECATTSLATRKMVAYVGINFSTFTCYVPATEVKTVFADQSNMFFISPTKKVLPYTVSKSVLDGGSRVSADYCQLGTEKQVWTLRSSKDS